MSDTNEPEVIEQQTCKLCGHKWFPRVPGVPQFCAKCKSKFWNIGRQRAPRQQKDTTSSQT